MPAQTSFTITITEQSVGIGGVWFLDAWIDRIAL